MIRPSSGDENMPDRQKRNQQIERFRGWSLTALYFALALWAIIFCLATYHFWQFLLERSGGSLWTPSSLAVLSIITFLLSARAGQHFLVAMRAQARLPRVDLLPFLAVAATIVIAGRAFGTT